MLKRGKCHSVKTLHSFFNNDIVKKYYALMCNHINVGFLGGKQMKLIKKTTVIPAVMIGVTLLSGCTNPFARETAQDVVEKMKENMVIEAQSFDEILADGVITDEEIKSIMDKVPSCTLTLGMNFAGSAEITENSASQKLEGKLHGDIEIEVDSEDKELHLSVNLSGNYYALGMNNSRSFGMDIYVINEDDGYYVYTKKGTDPAVRVYAGSLEEALSEDFDVAGFYEALEGKKIADIYGESFEENTMIKSMILSKNKVLQNDKNCYKLTLNADGNMILDVLKNDEQYIEELNRLDMTFEELMATEITRGLTVRDLINDMKFRCNYYISEDTYTLVSFDADFKEAVKSVFEDFYAASMGGNSNKRNFNIDITDAVVYYSYDESDVNVEFTGNYK